VLVVKLQEIRAEGEQRCQVERTHRSQRAGAVDGE